jgi:NADH-quinone oxidoreductase subunit G
MATIEIDGEKLDAELGSMVIEVADAAGIHIPRFCYHKKLTVVANCRMCLVEVGNARKPMPACATPVSDGMKVFTKTELAQQAQRSVMEFLLINHPLDCPICDQGGECELQDVAMGYGQDISRFTEGKRAVEDENLGSLISTEMTRCIHCTRCIRFGEEIAGLRELGATGRGEDMRIGTYIAQSMQSPLAANIIDLCPVGALTSKPYRFTARPWELQTKPSVAAHDCLGSAIDVHVRRQQVMRVVPQECESINECWLSDRDRYSYTAIEHTDRITEPMMKQNGQWVTVDWATAFEHVVEQLTAVVQRSPLQLGVLTSASSTLEECYLLQKLCRGLGCHNIDHRLHEVDFRDQAFAPIFPGSSVTLSTLEQQQAIFIIGSHVQQDVPLLATRVRKASLAGAKIHTLNAFDYPLNHGIDEKIITDLDQFAVVLAEVAVALSQSAPLPTEFLPLLRDIKPRAEAGAIAAQLQAAESAVILLGADALNQANAAAVRSLVKLVALMADAQVMPLTDGANAAGAWLAGAVPHRHAGGHAVEVPGMTGHELFQQPRQAYLLHNVEPELDYQDPQLALAALQQAQWVCVVSAYHSEAMLEYADVILPAGVFTETSGTMINLCGDWRSFHGCTKPPGEARPAWKIFRVLGNLLNIPGFDYQNTLEISTELSEQLAKQDSLDSDTWYYPAALTSASSVCRLGRWAIYNVDAMLRRALPLQQAASQDPLEVRVHPELAEQYNLRNGKQVTVTQQGCELTLTVYVDPRVSKNSVYFVSGHIPMGAAYGEITLK